MMRGAMLMAQRKAVPRAVCWLWHNPWQVVSGLITEYVSKKGDPLCLALCSCTEPLSLVISPHFGYATQAHFQASVVTYSRSVCVPSSEYRNFNSVWLIGVTLSLYGSTTEVWDAIFEEKRIIAGADLIIFTTISSHSKYWSFLHFLLLGLCFVQVC